MNAPESATRAATGSAARRPDASMTLLIDVMEHPLDPGYAAAAARRRSAAPVGRRVAAATVALALVCGWGVSWAVVQLRRPQPGAVVAREKLEAEIDKRTQDADQRQTANEGLRAQIAAAQAQALRSGGNAALAGQVQALGVATGETPVSGPGLEIVLDDAPRATDPAGTDPRQNAESDQGRVLDRDLQIVVNGLWASGAEAIAVNGQRLTSLSAIRSAGQAILVDFRPLSPPYLVQAIGSSTVLQTRFAVDMAGSYLQTLHTSYGVGVTITARKALSLPGAGALVLHQARPVPQASPPPDTRAPAAVATTPEVSP
jgi:uncharacterized protein YlxW (UPF0749 family)